MKTNISWKLFLGFSVILIFSVLVFISFAGKPWQITHSSSDVNPSLSLVDQGIAEAISIPITGGDTLNKLTCESATVFTLESGAAIAFPIMKPCDLLVSVNDETIEALPAPLPEGMAFLDAASVAVIQNGKAIEFLPNGEKVIVSFGNNANKIGRGYLSVLLWNENEGWNEVTFDSRLRAKANEVGLFVLVTRS